MGQQGTLAIIVLLVFSPHGRTRHHEQTESRRYVTLTQASPSDGRAHIMQGISVLAKDVRGTEVDFHGPFGNDQVALVTNHGAVRLVETVAGVRLLNVRVVARGGHEEPINVEDEGVFMTEMALGTVVCDC